MCLRQIANVQIVPDAGAVSRWVILSKDSQWSPVTCDSLGQERNEVGRRAEWQFTDFRTGGGRRSG